MNLHIPPLNHPIEPETKEILPDPMELNKKALTISTQGRNRNQNLSSLESQKKNVFFFLSNSKSLSLLQL